MRVWLLEQERGCGCGSECVGVSVGVIVAVMRGMSVWLWELVCCCQIGNEYIVVIVIV